LLLVKNMKWHLVGQKGLRFNLRVSKKQSSKHSFICMNNDLVCMRKHCLPIQIACLWLEKGLIRHVI
jgi:hypothetical protein